MRLHRTAVLALVGLVAACSADTGEQGMAEDAAEMMTPEAAIGQIRADYVTHYNLHHPDMVAALYGDSAILLSADGGVHEGNAAIVADLTADMAGSPQLNLTETETMVTGEYAVSRGTYGVTATPEGGEAMNVAGNYITFFSKTPEGWKISAVLTNFGAPTPEGFPYVAGDATMQPPPEAGTMGELIGQWTTHYNLGHAAMVGDLYTDDAVLSRDGTAPVQGKEAIVNDLAASIEAFGSPKVTVHDVTTMDIGNGYTLDGGWYETKGTAGAQTGAYIVILQQAPDGTRKIKWHYSNAQPMPAGG